jgi:ribonuclease P protein component
MKLVSVKSDESVLDTVNNSAVAICVSRSVRPAVARNRLKRIIREAVNESVSKIQPGFYIGLLPKPSFAGLNPSERKSQIESLLRKAGLLK